MRLPLRKSPCTRCGAAAVRRTVVGRASAAPSSNAGCGSPNVSSARALLVDLRRRRRADRELRAASSVSTAWMRAAISPHCAASRGRAVGVLVVAQDAAGDRLALDAVHHEAAAETVVGFEQRAHRRHRDARRPRPLRAARTRSSGPTRAARGAPGRGAAPARGARRPASTRSNVHVSRDAPPDSRRRPSTGPGVRTPAASARASAIGIGCITGHEPATLDQAISARFLHRPVRTPARLVSYPPV